MILLSIKCQMLAVLEPTTSQQDRHIAIVMTGGIAEVARQQHAGLIEQAALRFVSCLE